MKKILFLGALLVALLIPAVASASPVAVTAVAPSNFYGWCGGKTALQELQPDATPPATPANSCGEYAGSSGSLTVQLASAAGRLVVSEYVGNNAVPTTLALKVNGTQVGSSIAVPNNASGWLSFPATWVQSSDTVTVVTSSGWYQASGRVRVLTVHGELTPWMNPSWSQFGNPGNWATTPVPAGVATATGTSPQNGAPLSTQVPLEIAGEAKAQSYVNENSYSAPEYYQPLSTPLQPVLLCRAAGNCVPNWGPPTDDLWRMFMGLANGAVPNRTTGQCASNCNYVGGGVAMTDDVVPSGGTDGSVVVCLGGGDSGDPPWTLKKADGTPFVRPDGQQIQGNCWEMWQLRQNPAYDSTQPISTTNPKYEVSWGSHRTGFIQTLGVSAPDTSWTHAIDTLSGQYCPRLAAGEYTCGSTSDATKQSWFGPDVLVPGAADSTTYEVGWGVTAAELPLQTDIVQEADCQRAIDGASDYGHAIGVQLQYDRYMGSGLYKSWWPAGNSDGNNSHMAVGEGMRLFWPSSVAMPSGMSWSAQVFFRTVQKYGIVVDDTTGGGPGIAYNTADGSYASGGALNIRIAPPVRGEYNACGYVGTPSSLSPLLPWNQLQLIAEGSDSNPNP